MRRPATAHLVSGGTGQGSLPRNTPLLLVGGATTTVRRLAGHPHLGRFTQPRSQNNIDELATSGLWWAADNDALQGLDPDAYLRMLDQIAAADRSRLLFVTVPDAARMTPQGPEVSCEGTLWLFRSWLAALRKRRLPAALVAQDGLTVEQTPWDDIAALFIGGTDTWKDGPQVEALITAAQAREVWVHVGRINTWRRFRHFDALGIDSFDGSQFSTWPDTYIPEWLERIAAGRQMSIFTTDAGEV
jgi:hypothetical protein